jgi:hypothetical protein
MHSSNNPPPPPPSFFKHFARKPPLRYIALSHRDVPPEFVGVS